ncbi:U32 family peptidase [Escherichia coli]
MFKPELLSPAGTLKNMRYAFAYGADAVYAGQPRYSLRVRNNEFNHENLQLGINEAHALGKKFYVVVNIAPHNAKLKTFIRDLKPVVEMGPDALIMSDPGLIMLVREHFPEMPIHLSVQANAVNWATVKFWQQMGLTRVILSRELSLEEIEEIRNQVPDMEIEIFVHGALCMAYSGRCLLLWLYQQARPEPGHLHQRLAAGSTTSRKGKKMTSATSYTSTSRFRCKMLSRRWVSARQPTKCL